jgi:polysaccharide export outer membrane protein
MRSLAHLPVLLILCAGPLAAQQPVERPADPSPTLAPGDVVRLKIWREPDLSGDYSVDEGGIAVFPKIGAVGVQALTTDSLKRYLVATYEAYLRNPAVEVTVLRRVNVLGAVRNPGLYQVDATKTVADVIADAGGATSDGNRKRVDLLRTGTQFSLTLSRDTRLADTPLRSGDQLFVPDRSWLSRNSGSLVVGLLTAGAIVAAALIR